MMNKKLLGIVLLALVIVVGITLLVLGLTGNLFSRPEYDRDGGDVMHLFYMLTSPPMESQL
ncbi:MAG: hypothetical protein FWE38_03215 [Firmicutes bacterium]|nr:hypothetical protein [Bacillota bacterium]